MDPPPSPLSPSPCLLLSYTQEKQKSYRAVCWLPRPLTDADVALLEATRDLEVQQETPVRVGGWVGAWMGGWVGVDDWMHW